MAFAGKSVLLAVNKMQSNISREAEPLLFSLSHNISLQLSNSWVEEEIPLFTPTPLTCFLKRTTYNALKKKSIVGVRETHMFFFSRLIMDSTALKSMNSGRETASQQAQYCTGQILCLQPPFQKASGHAD